MSKPKKRALPASKRPEIVETVAFADGELTQLEVGLLAEHYHAEYQRVLDCFYYEGYTGGEECRALLNARERLRELGPYLSNECKAEIKRDLRKRSVERLAHARLSQEEQAFRLRNEFVRNHLSRAIRDLGSITHDLGEPSRPRVQEAVAILQAVEHDFKA
jgi:hypothetical protein